MAYSISDKLAIALACLAGIMAIILFLVEKTPTTIVSLLILMLALSIYPILHFVKRVGVRIAVFSLFAIGTLRLGWYVWPHEHSISANNQKTQQPEPEPQQSKSEESKPEGKNHAKRNSVQSPSIESSSSDTPESNVIDNSGGKMEDTYIENSHATAPPNGRASVIKNRGGETKNTRVIDSDASTAPLAVTPPNHTAAINMDHSSGSLIMNSGSCGTSSGIKTGSNNGNAIVNFSVNDPHVCNWFYFLEEARKHRQDISVFLNRRKGRMVLSMPESPERFSAQRDAMIQSLTEKSLDENGFNEAITKLQMNPPMFDVKP